MEDNMYLEEITKLAEELIESQRPYLESLKETFEFIKYRNITRESQIERLLDDILSLLQTKETLDLYIRVCEYYFSINREAAIEYAKIYLDMYEDDTVLNKIRKLDVNIKSKSLFYQRDYFGRIN